MRLLRLLLMVLAFAAAAAGTVAFAQPQSGIVRPTTEPRAASVALGAELYAGNCASCHGIDGSGVSSPRPGAGNITGAGPPLRGVGARAADFYLSLGLMPLENVHAQPEIRRMLFSRSEVESLVAYVASLAPGPAIPHPEPERGHLGEGFRLFSEHCAGCHQAVAAGGFVTGARVPPLQRLTPVQIAEAVRVGPYLMPRFPTSQISDAQLNSIVAYVRSTNHPDNRGGWAIGNLGPVPEGMIAWLTAIILAILCVGLGRRFRT